MLDDAVELHEFDAGSRLTIGPFEIATYALPHSTPNDGMRIGADGRVVSYTGDTGPCAALVDLAQDADLYLAEASYAHRVPADMAQYLSSATDAGVTADRADASRLMLTHLMPGTATEAAVECAARNYSGEIAVARPGVVIRLGS